MSTYTERRTDTTVSLAVAMRVSHRDAVEAISQHLPEFPQGQDKLTRAESMAVAEKVCPERSLEVFKALRGDEQ